MLHVVYTNDSDIDCEGDDLSDPAGDYCNDRIRYSYVRTYALLLGKFANQLLIVLLSLVSYSPFCPRFLPQKVILNSTIIGILPR